MRVRSAWSVVVAALVVTALMSGGVHAAGTIYQAEDAVLYPAPPDGPTVVGSYVDFTDTVASGEYIELTVSAAVSGLHELAFKYALGSGADRPLELTVNGVVITSSLSFPNTGGWNYWAYTLQDVTLVTGSNTVRIATNGSYGANVDHLEVTELAPPDTEAPTVPTALIATAISGTQIDVQWDASTDNVGVFGYDVLRDGVPIDSVTGTSYGDTGLTEITTYVYTVRAFDEAGNTSAESTSASETTLDATPPSVPGNLNATAVSPDQIDLSWDASTDNVGVESYSIVRDGVPVGTSTGVSYSDTDLTPDTEYVYTVSASDAAGNTSAASASATESTHVLPSFDPVVYEAEDATLVGPIVDMTPVPCADYQNANNDYIEWTVTASAAGDHELAFRYVQAGSSDRPLEISVNGTPVEPNPLSFPHTGSWTTWEIVSLTATLDYGTNAIRATAIGSSGGNIDYLRVTLLDTEDPSTPQNLLAVIGTSPEVNLTWDASTDGYGSGVTHYRVHRDGVEIATEPSTSYNDTTITVSGRYTYRVSAVDASGNESRLSSESWAEVCENVPPAAPRNLCASLVSPGLAEVDWVDNDEADLFAYKLYRDTSSGFTPDASTIVATLTDSQYTDSSIVTGTDYFYVVTASDTESLVSAPSAEAEAAGIDDGLVGYWRFDDQAQLGLDSSGQGNDVTVAGAVWTSDGAIGSALDLDGDNDRCDVPFGIVGARVGAIAFWTKPIQDYSERTIIYYGTDGVTTGDGYGPGTAFHVGINGDEQFELFRGGAGAPVTGPISYSDGEWHHVVAVWDAVKLTLYVDGELAASDFRGSADFDFTTVHRLGRPGANWRCYEGLLDEVRLYNRPLHASEAKALANSANFETLATNGAEGSGIMPIPVSLTDSLETTVSVDYAVTGGSATQGQDYTLAAGTLVFSPGEVTKYIQLNVLTDVESESDETVEISLESSIGIAIGETCVHTHTINEFGIVSREVQDSGTANDRIDRIRMVASSALNDDFSGFTATVVGHGVTGYDTGTAGDDEFFVLLQESSDPDTGAPGVQITANTSLMDSTELVAIPLDTGPNTPSDAVAPVVVSVDPADQTDPASVRTPVTLLFSEAMDHLSTQTAFSLSPTATGSYAWPASDTVVFTANDVMSSGTTYAVAVSTSATDLAGNSLSAAHSSSFTTGGGLVVSIPATSATSPLFVEGEYWQGEGEDYPVVGNGEFGDTTAVVLDGTRFFVDLPLQPGSNAVSIRRDGSTPLVSLSGAAEWQKTDLTGMDYSSDTVTIREGDSLLLTATGSGSTLEIRTDAAGNFVTVPEGPGNGLEALYDTAREYVAEAMIDGVSVGTLSVVVIGVDMTKPIACQIGYKREKEIPIAPIARTSEVFFSVTDDAVVSDFRVTEQTTEGALLEFRAIQHGTSSIVARLGDADGPILGWREVNEFTLENSASGIIHAENDPEGGRTTVGTHYRMIPFIDEPNIDITSTIRSPGITFDNGDTIMTFTAADFTTQADGSGIYYYSINIAPGYSSFCMDTDVEQHASSPSYPVGHTIGDNGEICLCRITITSPSEDRPEVTQGETITFVAEWDRCEPCVGDRHSPSADYEWESTMTAASATNESSFTALAEQEQKIQTTYVKVGCVTCVDDEGATHCAHSIKMSEINFPPDAVASATPETVNSGDIITLDGTASTDEDGSIESYDWGVFGTGATRQVAVANANPPRNIEASAIPSEGLEPLLVNFSCTADIPSPDSITATLTVTDDDDLTDTDTATVTVNHSGALSYAWDYDDGTAYGIGRTTIHTYNAVDGGDLSAAAESDPNPACVGDGIQFTGIANWSRTYNAEVTVATTSGASATGAVPVEVTGEADIKTWEWDFDEDGTIDSTDQNPIHAYSGPGEYTASLEVTDTKDDTASASVEITVVNLNLDIIKPDGLPVSEEDEEGTGEMLQVNIDDDDNDGGSGGDSQVEITSDKDDTNGVAGEDDFLELIIRKLEPDDLEGLTYKLSFSDENIAIWMNNDMSGPVESNSTEFSIDSDTSVYVEGKSPSASLGGELVSLILYDGATEVGRDTVKVVVAEMMFAILGHGGSWSHPGLHEYLGSVKRDSRTYPYIVLTSDKCYSVWVPDTDKEKVCKIALSAEDSYVAFDGHSNFGLGFGFATHRTSISQFMNVAENLVSLDWVYMIQNQSHPALHVEDSEYGDDVTTTELYDPWRYNYSYPGSSTTYTTVGFDSGPHAGGDHLSLERGDYKHLDHHYKTSDGELRIVVKSGQKDMPTKRWKKMLVNSCYSGHYYYPVFNHGVLFFTTAAVESGNATKEFFKSIIDGGEANNAIVSSLNAVEPAYDYWDFGGQ